MPSAGGDVRARSAAGTRLRRWTFGINGLLGPVGGAIADRFDRRRVIVLANLGAAACSAALVFVRVPAAMIAIAFVASVIGRTCGPAANASIPNLAGTEQLTWANGTMSVAWNTGRLVGDRSRAAPWSDRSGSGRSSRPTR